MSPEFLVKRLLHLLAVTAIIAVTVFVVLRLTPGDPVALMMGQDESVTAESIERKRVALGLDRPFYVQLTDFATGLLTGDLGSSLVAGRPVAQLLVERFPATLELAFAAMFVSLLLGITVGIIAALRQNSLVDRLLMAGNFLGLSMPVFWQGIMLILLFSVTLNWLPSMSRISYELMPQRVTGMHVVDAIITGNGRALVDALAHLALPALTAGTAYGAILARVVRSSMLEVLSQDYVRTARSKGLAPRRIILRHAFRNALIPVITVAGLEAGSLLSGSVVLETVFSWPGLGRLLIDGIYARDYPVVQSSVIVLCIMYVMVSFVVDLLYSVADPRIRW